MLGLGECNGTLRMQQFAILQYEGGPTWPTRPQPSYEDGENAKGIVSIEAQFAFFYSC